MDVASWIESQETLIVRTILSDGKGRMYNLFL